MVSKLCLVFAVLIAIQVRKKFFDNEKQMLDQQHFFALFRQVCSARHVSPDTANGSRDSSLTHPSAVLVHHFKDHPHKDLSHKDSPHRNHPHHNLPVKAAKKGDQSLLKKGAKRIKRVRFLPLNYFSFFQKVGLSFPKVNYEHEQGKTLIVFDDFIFYNNLSTNSHYFFHCIVKVETHIRNRKKNSTRVCSA